MKSTKIDRRTFLTSSGAAAGVAAAGLFASERIAADSGDAGAPAPIGTGGNKVALICDPEDKIAAEGPAQWAIGELEKTLSARGVSVRRARKIGEATAGEFCIVAASAASPWIQKILQQAKISLPITAETVALASAGVEDRTVLFAIGTDARGLVYALLELADRVLHTDPPLAAIESQKPLIEQPANSIRSVARLFASDVEDLPWYRDKEFWKSYLTMLASERFNRFALTLGLGYDFTRQIRDSYFYFAYPFFQAVPGYDVRAVGLAESERDRNLAMLRFISDEAKLRGIDFQLGLWCHAYKWSDSAQVNYEIEGLTAENHAKYCRDALSAVLKACPAITGVTIRTHGESGVPEGSYEFWQSIFDGAAGAGRKVEIDLHAKGIDQTMIDGALSTGMPVNVSPKYWAEHMGLPYQQASIRALELPKPGQRGQGLFALSSGSRSFMRYSYGDLMSEDRKYGIIFRVWPGTTKLLLWGDPESAAAWGRFASFCGSQGIEFCEPLSFKGKKGSGLAGGRNGYEDASLKPEHDWEKYAYTYRLWGRLTFNPEADPEVWRRMLRKRWEAAAPAAEEALAAASRILPLVTSAHLPSAANANYWPEMYTNMSISDASAAHPYSDSPSPKRFGTVSPLDPAMFSTVDEYAEEIVGGKFSGKYSPANVVGWLSGFVDATAKNLAKARHLATFDGKPELARLGADLAIQVGLGRFYAAKMHAALLFALYQKSGDRKALEGAVMQYQAARDAWAEMARGAELVYVSDITFGPEKNLRGHWSDRLAAINQDVDRLAKLLEQKSDEPVPQASSESLKRIGELIGSWRAPTPDSVKHDAPQSFRAGQEIPLAIVVDGGASAAPTAAELHYRHVNQAESYKTAPMKLEGARFAAAIPAEYTQSPYPLQYFFALHREGDPSWLFPGLGPKLCSQPYFVIRQAT